MKSTLATFALPPSEPALFINGFKELPVNVPFFPQIMQGLLIIIDKCINFVEIPKIIYI